MTSKCFMRIYKLLLNFITLAGLPAEMQLSDYYCCQEYYEVYRVE